MVMMIAQGAVLYMLPRLTHVSVRPGDHGYRNWMALGESRRGLVVTLNGKAVERCIAADTRAGYVDFFIQHHGKLVMNKHRDGAVIHRLYGVVDIKLPGGTGHGL